MARKRTAEDKTMTFPAVSPRVRQCLAHVPVSVASHQTPSSARRLPLRCLNANSLGALDLATPRGSFN